MQVNASLRNQKGGQTVWACMFTQVAKGRKFHAYTDDSRSTCVDLRWVAKLVSFGRRKLASTCKSRIDINFPSSFHSREVANLIKFQYNSLWQWNFTSHLLYRIQKYHPLFRNHSLALISDRPIKKKIPSFFLLFRRLENIAMFSRAAWQNW